MTQTDVIRLGHCQYDGDTEVGNVNGTSGGGHCAGSNCGNSLANFQTFPFDCGKSTGYANDDAFFHRQHCQHTTNRIDIVKRHDRISIFVGLTIWLISYLKSIGWRGFCMIYSIQYIRLNVRALLHVIATIRFKENFKAIGQTAIKVQPILKLITRQSATDRNEFHKEIKTAMVKAMADVEAEAVAAAAEAEEEECVSFEILSQPRQGIPISADIVFIHGLHGSSNDTWKQGEWEYKPQTNQKFIKIKRHDANNNSNESNQHEIEHFHHLNLHQHVEEEQQQSSESSTAENARDNDNNKNELIINSITGCWPKDWLPYDCPNVRIAAINYDTDPHLWRPIWYPSRKRTNLMSRANKMIKLLVENGIGAQRPIVWVGHSKGGLYVKQVIVNAYASRMAAAHQLWESTRGVLFYSVPHSGSPLADLNLPFLAQSIEMIEIRKNFPSIVDLHRRFVALCRNSKFNINVFSFIEMELTQLSVLYLRIIDVISGDPGIGEVCSVPLDHFDVCKPRHRNCFLYKQLTRMINQVIANYHSAESHS